MLTSGLVALPFLLIVILIIGGYLYLRHQRGADRARASTISLPPIQTAADTPINFGPKMLWFAIPAPSAQAVAEALALQATQPANWQSGIHAAYELNHIFVTPPINGWVLALGQTLPTPEASATPWRALMTTLSQRFGVAHFYGTQRVSGYVTWAIYEAGVERRVFVAGDEVMLNRGHPFPEEVARLRQWIHPEKIGDKVESIEDAEGWIPDEDDLFELAGAWSMNPIKLETLNVPPSVGLVGLIPRPGRATSHPFPHSPGRRTR